MLVVCLLPSLFPVLLWKGIVWVWPIFAYPSSFEGSISFLSPCACINFIMTTSLFQFFDVVDSWLCPLLRAMNCSIKSVIRYNFLEELLWFIPCMTWLNFVLRVHSEVDLLSLISEINVGVCVWWQLCFSKVMKKYETIGARVESYSYLGFRSFEGTCVAFFFFEAYMFLFNKRLPDSPRRFGTKKRKKKRFRSNPTKPLPCLPILPLP